MKRFEEMRQELIEMAEKEAVRLWRQARRAEAHGCDVMLVAKLRDEGHWLHNTATTYPDRLLAWDFRYKMKFAFQLGGECK